MYIRILVSISVLGLKLSRFPCLNGVTDSTVCFGNGNCSNLLYCYLIVCFYYIRTGPITSEAQTGKGMLIYMYEVILNWSNEEDARVAKVLGLL